MNLFTFNKSQLLILFVELMLISVIYASSPSKQQQQTKQEETSQTKFVFQSIKLPSFNSSLTICEDICALMLFLLSVLYYSKQSDLLFKKRKKIERDVLRKQEENKNHKIEEIEELIYRSTPVQLNQGYFEKDKYILEIYQFENIFTLKRVFDYDEVYLQKLQSNQCLSQFVNQGLKNFSLKNLFDKGDKYQSLPVQKIDSNQSEYFNTIQNIEKAMLKLIKNRKLLFWKVLFFQKIRILVHKKIKVIVYISTQKEVQKKSKTLKGDLNKQIENFVLELIKANIKIRKIKRGEDFDILNQSTLIFNPLIAWKHDPEISFSYHKEIYNQLCKQLGLSYSQTFADNLTHQ